MKLDADVIVVGAGFCGVACTLEAERRGAKVLLIDWVHPFAASRAASGYVAQSWYKGAAQQRALCGLELAESHGVRFDWTGADQVRTDGTRTTKADWGVFDPLQFLDLRMPDGHATVTSVRATSFGAIANTPGSSLKANHVVLAVGAGTDKLLKNSALPPIGVTGLGGRGILFSGKAPSRTLLKQTNPFHSYAVRPWGDGFRVGETIEHDAGKASTYVDKMLRATQPLVDAHARPTGELWGLRPVCANGPIITEITPGIVVATGGGRVGSLLAFWAATEVCRTIGLP